MFIRRWFVRIFWFLIVLVLAYILLARGLIAWVQYSPQTIIQLADRVFHVQVDYQELKLDQTWSGFELNANNLQIQHPSWYFETEQIDVSFHLLTALWPSLPFGEHLIVEDARVELLQTNESSEFEPNKLFLKLSKLWRQIQVKKVAIYSDQLDGYYLYIDSFNASFVERWVVLADVDVKNNQHQTLADFQFSGHFIQDRFARLESGRFNVKQKSTAKIDYLKAIWPEATALLKRMPEGEAELSLAGEVVNFQLADLRLTTNLSKLQWVSETVLPESIGFIVNWTQVSGGFQWGRMQASLTQVEFNQQAVAGLSPILLAKEGAVLNVDIKQLSILPFSDLLVHLVGKQAAQLDAFELINSSIDFNLTDLRFEQARLNVSNLVWKDGQTRVNLAALSINLQDDWLELDLKKPIIFHTSWTEQKDYQITSRQPWKIKLSPDHQAWSLALSSLKINEMRFDLEGQGQLDGEVDLKLYGEIGSIHTVKNQVLPYHLMPEIVTDWLESALVGGEDITLKAIMKGNLKDFPFADQKDALKIQAVAQNAELKFNEDWPSIKDFTAYIDFEPFDLKISSSKGTIYGADARDIVVDIKHLASEDIAVEVKAHAFTDSQQGLDFLLASPLAAQLSIEGFIENYLTATGRMRVDMDYLFVPIEGYEDRDIEVAGKIHLAGRINLMEVIEFDDVDGILAFSADTLWTPEPVNVKALGGTHKINVETQRDAKQIVIDLIGNTALDDWYGFSGEAPINAQVNVPYGGDGLNGAHVFIDAQAKNLTSHWPYPLNQQALESLVHVELDLERSRTALKLNASDFIRADIEWLEQEGEPPSAPVGLISIGMTEQNRVSEQGLKFIGEIETLDLDQWLKVWPRMNDLFDLEKNENSESGLMVWQESNLLIHQLKFLEHNYPQIALDWKSQGAQFILATKSDYADLQLSYLNDPEPKMYINVDLLRVQLSDSGTTTATLDDISTAEPKDSCLKPVVSKPWPNIEFKGQNILVGQRLFDSISFKTDETDLQRRIRGLEFEFAGRSGKGQTDYVWFKDTNKSELTLNLTSKNVAALSDFIGIQKGFSGKRGQFDASLNWGGDLSCFSLTQTSGQFSARFDEGVIEQLEPGLARLLGLLSVDSIVRRLKLDIKDVTNKGMDYSSINVNGLLQGGQVLLNGLNLKSPGVKIDMNGRIYLKTKTLDLTAEVTPAVGAALPAIAGIIGLANPVTGILAYVIAKNLPFINEDIISYSYQVGGDWVDPKIKSKGGSLLFK